MSFGFYCYVHLNSSILIDLPLLVQDSLCWVSLARCFVLWRMMQIFPGIFTRILSIYSWYLVIQWYIRLSKMIVFSLLLFPRFDELFSQVLKILPAQVENVQEMFEELSAMDRTRKKSVIFNPGQRHQELWMIARIQWQIKLAKYILIVDEVLNWQNCPDITILNSKVGPTGLVMVTGHDLEVFRLVLWLQIQKRQRLNH